MAQAPAKAGGLLDIQAEPIGVYVYRREPRELKRDEIRLDRHRALALCLSMIFSENHFTLFRIML
jgi:hypothetical protein